MIDNGDVCVPRSKLADILGVNPRRITSLFAAAVEARVLDSVSAGGPGHTAVYTALTPSKSIERQRRRNAVLTPIVVTTCAPSETGQHGDHVPTKQVVTTCAPTAHAQHGDHVVPANTHQPTQREVQNGALGEAQNATPSKTPRSAKVASAAEHPLNPDNSDFDSSSARSRRSREPAKPEQPKTLATDDEYATAREDLGQIGAALRDRYMAQAHNSLENASNRDLIVYAANIARSVGEVA